MTSLAKKRLRLWGMGLKLAAASVGFLILALLVCLAAAVICFAIVGAWMNLQGSIISRGSRTGAWSRD